MVKLWIKTVQKRAEEKTQIVKRAAELTSVNLAFYVQKQAA